MRWGIYLHIPFCRAKCHYCDFASYAGAEHEMERYIRALKREMQQRLAIYLEKYGAPHTIYFGGGTPTALPQQLFEDLLAALYQGVFQDAAVDAVEWTVEANPGTVDAPYLEALAKWGVNRISFGVQSFSDQLLQGMGRIHTAQEARDAVLLARSVGIPKISLDLIYALPDQRLEDLQASIQEAVALEVGHISIYGLQVEEGTKFFRMQQAGALHLPSEELSEEMYDFLTSELPKYGYQRYEISNFAKIGQESRHNLGYWQDMPYLGLGAAAHSYLDGLRWANPDGLQEYMEGIEQRGVAVELEEAPTRREAMEEYCFLALRTEEGISEQGFERKFSVRLSDIFGEPLRKFEMQGLLLRENGRAFLTDRGMKLGNIVFEGFLLDD